MSLDLLGEGFDLHGGGIDLCFPHHENERAQAVALGREFANHWVHNGFVEVDGEKMSKSLGNFTTLTDMLDRTDPRAYRMLVLRAHYRSPIEVTEATISDAEAALSRLDDFARRFNGLGDGELDQDLLTAFNAHMDNDLDSPAAVAEMFSAARQANVEADKSQAKSAALKARAVLSMAEVLGLQLRGDSDELDDVTRSLISQRDQARGRKDWLAADGLREQLQDLGWKVGDSATGTTVHR